MAQKIGSPLDPSLISTSPPGRTERSDSLVDSLFHLFRNASTSSSPRERKFSGPLPPPLNLPLSASETILPPPSPASTPTSPTSSYRSASTSPSSSYTIASSPDSTPLLDYLSPRQRMDSNQLQIEIDKLFKRFAMMQADDVKWEDYSTDKIRRILKRCYLILSHHGDTIQHTNSSINVSDVMKLLSKHKCAEIRKDPPALNHWIRSLVERQYRPLLSEYARRLSFFERSQPLLEQLARYNDSFQEASENSRSTSVSELDCDFFDGCKKAYAGYLNLFNTITTEPSGGHRVIEHYVRTAPESKPEGLRIPELYPCLKRDRKANLLKLLEEHHYHTVMRDLLEIPDAIMPIYEKNFFLRIKKLALHSIDLLCQDDIRPAEAMTLRGPFLVYEANANIDWDNLSTVLDRLASHCKF